MSPCQFSAEIGSDLAMVATHDSSCRLNWLWSFGNMTMANLLSSTRLNEQFCFAMVSKLALTEGWPPEDDERL
jgi:hypothetical protein